jgi:hypothetical protein
VNAPPLPTVIALNTLDVADLTTAVENIERATLSLLATCGNANVGSDITPDLADLAGAAQTFRSMLAKADLDEEPEGGPSEIRGMVTALASKARPQ